MPSLRHFCGPAHHISTYRDMQMYIGTDVYVTRSHTPHHTDLLCSRYSQWYLRVSGLLGYSLNSRLRPTDARSQHFVCPVSDIGHQSHLLLFTPFSSAHQPSPDTVTSAQKRIQLLLSYICEHSHIPHMSIVQSGACLTKDPGIIYCKISNGIIIRLKYTILSLIHDQTTIRGRIV